MNATHTTPLPTRQWRVNHVKDADIEHAMTQQWIKQMWHEAQQQKIAFIKNVSDIELRYLRRHKLTKKDVSFVWLDELLIGIEVKEARRRRILYDDELTAAHK